MASDAGKPRRQPLVAPPRTLDVRKYAESRAAELESLHSIVSTRLNNDFRSQRNKRRRTTGFESKRRRNFRRDSQKSGDVEEKENDKKLPRRVRRRIELTKKNLELGFSVSGDGTKRLRTHVWHAKRFTMEKIWGFYLPLGLHGRGRGSRALLKWYKQGAVVHDASYYSAVQLEGPEDALSSILNLLLVPSSMDRSEDICKRLLSGEIYGRAMLHHSREYGYKAICPVTYMWRPFHQHKSIDSEDRGIEENVSSSCLRQIWIWIHPSAFMEGLDCLKLACQMMMNETGVRVGCVPLDGKFGKLDVMGQKAFQLLQKILHPITHSLEDPLRLSTGSTLGDTYACEIKQNNILEKEEGFLSGAAVLLTVLDPRSSCLKRSAAVPDVHLPDDRNDSLKDKSKENSTRNLLMKEEVPSTSQSKYESISSLSNFKDLWDASSEVHPPVEEHILCLERHQKSLDFFCMKSTSTELVSDKGQSSSFCPIMLLRNADEAGLHNGWSIILPICWVKAFWIPLVSGGVHAVGLREKHWIACDVGLPCFPSDFPDCNAHCNLMEREAVAVNKKMGSCSLVTKLFKIPIQLPWNSKWFAFYRGVGEGGGIEFSRISGENGDEPLDIFVARTTRMLTSFLKEVSGDNLLLFPKEIGRRSFSFLMMKEAEVSQTSNMDTWISDRRKLCYLRVVLHAFKEGAFEERAVVCAPRCSDITLLTSGLDNNEGVQVPRACVGSYFKELPSGKWEFQLPDDPAAREAYRPPIGFVTSGFVRGSKRPAAVAYCEALLLAHLRNEQWSRVPAKKRRKEIFVLVRNLRSTAYRLTLASIVLESQEEDVESL